MTNIEFNIKTLKQIFFRLGIVKEKKTVLTKHKINTLPQITKKYMSRSNVKIRVAVPEDLQILKEFEQEIIRYERAFAKNLKQDPIVYYDLENYIKRSDVQILVATSEGKPIGSGYAMIKDSEPFKTPGQFVYLGFMFVVHEQRGKGINGMIINELLKWVKEKKIVEIQLDVYAENNSALKAYQKIGFKPDLLKMRLKK